MNYEYELVTGTCRTFAASLKRSIGEGWFIIGRPFATGDKIYSTQENGVAQIAILIGKRVDP